MKKVIFTGGFTVIEGKPISGGQVVELEDRYADMLIDAGSAIAFTKQTEAGDEVTEQVKAKRQGRPANKAAKIAEDK